MQNKFITRWWYFTLRDKSTVSIGRLVLDGRRKATRFTWTATWESELSIDCIGYAVADCSTNAETRKELIKKLRTQIIMAKNPAAKATFERMNTKK